MLPDWVTQAAIGGLCLIVWWELRTLRRSRGSQADKITTLGADMGTLKSDVHELRTTVTDMRDALLEAGIIRARVGAGGQHWNVPG